MTSIIYSDNGTLSDVTSKLATYGGDSQAFTFVAAEDAIYIGSEYPFTQQFIKVGTVNAAAATLSASYWDGSAWRSTASFYDQTSVSGVTLARSGYISFITDKRYCWIAADTQSNGLSNITGLGTVNLFDKYWIKLTSSANISMTLDWFGLMFCDEDDVGDFQPQVLDSTFMTNWESGKTNWEPQRRLASDILINKLKVNRLVHENLILNNSQLKLAGAYQTLAIIYQSLGDGYTERYNEYEKLANRYLESSIQQDVNINGRPDPAEIGMATKTMVR